ncbi:MAG: acetyl-CoA carboxylase biotin carboxyl carrier protein subunit [Anaerolineae bacterium]|nr:acetyl-CoA carboxylase biotin carboxyl carrier protein subunit [Anaerolineae bacterium]
MKLTVKVEGQPIQVEIKDPYARPVIAIVDGETFEVYPEEPSAVVDHPAAEPRKLKTRRDAPQQNGKNINAVNAPIPGVVVSVSVQPGDEVRAGQEVCMIEAMKMKNPIRSTRSGIIAAVHVTVGQQVNHNDMLVEFDVQ